MESNRYRWLPKVQMITNVTNGEYLAIGKHIAVHSLKATNGAFGHRWYYLFCLSVMLLKSVLCL